MAGTGTASPRNMEISTIHCKKKKKKRSLVFPVHLWITKEQ
jgi:hypothetical protein